MIINLDIYAVNKKFIQEWYLKNKDRESVSSVVSTLACATMCPCIVIAYWVGEASGWNPESIACIKSLTKFYGYTHVLGKPENSPV